MAIKAISNIDVCVGVGVGVGVGVDDDGDVNKFFEREINNLLRLSELLSIKEMKYVVPL